MCSFVLQGMYIPEVCASVGTGGLGSGWGGRGKAVMLPDIHRSVHIVCANIAGIVKLGAGRKDGSARYPSPITQNHQNNKFRRMSPVCLVCEAWNASAIFRANEKVRNACAVHACICVSFQDRKERDCVCTFMHMHVDVEVYLHRKADSPFAGLLRGECMSSKAERGLE